MALRVNSNQASLGAQRHLAQVTTRLAGNYRRLSSGLRVASAADDPAGLAISERMRARIASLAQAGRNAQDGISAAQTAEGAQSEIANNLSRMRELAVQAANGTLSTTDRASLDAEFQALIAEIDRVASDTDFNGLSLLDGSQPNMHIQVGTEAFEVVNVSYADLRAAALGLGGDLLTDAAASVAIGVADLAIDQLSSARGVIGAAMNRLSSVIRSNATSRENLTAAESRIRDVDVAFETADLTRNSILQQAAVSVLSQANLQPQIALSLLQGPGR